METFFLKYRFYPRKKILIDQEFSTYIALGFFDGVHSGHQALLKLCVERANHAQAVSAVVLLDPHPKKIVNRMNNFSLLTTLSEKIKRIRGLGIQQVIVLSFTDELKKISAEDFIAEVLFSKFKMGAVFIGYNYHFGYQKKGDIDLIRLLSNKYNFKYYVLEPVKIDKGTIVSSTAIKNYLKNGDIVKANRMLGYPYQINGEVIHGDKRGKNLLSFPTANLKTPKDKLLPQNGIYITSAEIQGKRYQGLANIGIKPTFNQISVAEKIVPTIEVHLFNFEKDIYRKKMTISLLKKIRDEIKFQDSKELSKQISKDQLVAEKFFETEENMGFHYQDS